MASIQGEVPPGTYTVIYRSPDMADGQAGGRA